MKLAGFGNVAAFWCLFCCVCCNCADIFLYYAAVPECDSHFSRTAPTPPRAGDQGGPSSSARIASAPRAKDRGITLPVDLLSIADTPSKTHGGVSSVGGWVGPLDPGG